MDPKPPIIGKWRKIWWDQELVAWIPPHCDCEYTETECFEYYEFPPNSGLIKQIRFICEHFPGRVRHSLPQWNGKGNEATYTVVGEILTLTDAAGRTFKMRRID